MGQQISIDPELWAKTRRTAFDRRMTASQIVVEALVDWFDKHGPREGTAEGVATPIPPVNGIRLSHAEETVFKELSLTAEEMLATGKVIDKAGQSKMEFTFEDGSTGPGKWDPSLGKVIPDQPESIALAAQELSARKGRPFTPVPKPGSKKKGSR